MLYINAIIGYLWRTFLQSNNFDLCKLYYTCTKVCERSDIYPLLPTAVLTWAWNNFKNKFRVNFIHNVSVWHMYLEIGGCATHYGNDWTKDKSLNFRLFFLGWHIACIKNITQILLQRKLMIFNWIENLWLRKGSVTKLMNGILFVNGTTIDEIIFTWTNWIVGCWRFK